MLTFWVAPPKCCTIGIGFKCAETNCGIGFELKLKELFIIIYHTGVEPSVTVADKTWFSYVI